MIGTKLAHYEITSHLGTGGMGEVYQAIDSKLGRRVAIKLLPEAFSRDADRLARFEREARVLASLNHPHIAAIYGLEESGGRKFLAMELVPGETLADRISRGPIPLDEALKIAGQIAEALEAAHEKGVMHRDLKPANIKVTPDGHVKVLDFGLAKAFEGEEGNTNLSNSPTITMGATNAGVILGTAAYMSPEQAKGGTVDKRTDIFAFGVVLYEMLTGIPLHQGETISEVMAAVIKEMPDLNRVPARVRPLLRSCLQKDPKQRLHDVGDAKLLLEVSVSPAEPDSKPIRSRPLWMAIAALSSLAAIALAALWIHQYLTPVLPVRFIVLPPAGGVIESVFSSAAQQLVTAVISPDGSKLAFPSRDASGKVMTWVRSLDTILPVAIPGTEESGGAMFWSPDSQSLAFFSQGMLRKVKVTGGHPQPLCDAPNGRGGTWNRDNTIVFAPNTLGVLYRCSEEGGAFAVTQLLPGQLFHTYPTFLPDGRHFTYFAGGTSASASVSGVYLGSLDSLVGTRLLAADSGAKYVSPGYLVFVRKGTLLAQAFDGTKILNEETIPLAESLSVTSSGSPAFSISDNGTLTFRTGPSSQNLQLAWFDRKGTFLESVGEAGGYRGVDLSPDGKQRIVTHRHDGNGGDVWMGERIGPLRPFTADKSQDNSMPIWSPKGDQIVFSSLRNEKWGLYKRPSDGSGNEEKLFESDAQKVPMSWSPNGEFIVYWVLNPKTNGDLWKLTLADHMTSRLMDSKSNESYGQISPSGIWIAYASDATQRNEIYVQPLTSGEGKRQISTDGGRYPRWSADGKELFYINIVGKMVAVKVNDRAATWQQGVSEILFDSGTSIISHIGGDYFTYAVRGDGQQFLIPRPPETFKKDFTLSPITVVLHWTDMLKK